MIDSAPIMIQNQQNSHIPNMLSSEFLKLPKLPTEEIVVFDESMHRFK